MIKRYREVEDPTRHRRSSAAQPSSDNLYYDDFVDGIYFDKYTLTGSPSYPYTEASRRINAASYSAQGLQLIQPLIVDFPICVEYYLWSGGTTSSDYMVQAGSITIMAAHIVGTETIFAPLMQQVGWVGHQPQTPGI